MIKKEKKLQNIYLTYCNLLMAQHLLQPHHQILSVILLMEFIELNLNLDLMIKSVKHAESNIGIATVFSNVQTLKVI